MVKNDKVKDSQVSTVGKEAMQNTLAFLLVDNLEKLTSAIEELLGNAGIKLSDPCCQSMSNLLLEIITGTGLIAIMNLHPEASVDFAKLLDMSLSLKLPITAEQLKAIGDKYQTSEGKTG